MSQDAASLLRPGLVDWILLVGSYALGSISASYWIVRLVTGRDVRTIGSGNAGATNVLRTAGTGPAFATLLFDLAKGLAPVFLARASGAGPAVVSGCAVAAVLGHVLPVFHGFRGGKGVATAAGALTALAPLPALAVVVLFGVVVSLTRYVSLGSIIGAASFPLLILLAARFGWPSREGGFAVVAASFIAALVLFMHRGNLQRLLAGSERRLGAGGSAADGDGNKGSRA